MDSIKSVYIHIPFCKTICSYCDFCKIYYDHAQISDYLSALKKEIKINYKNEKIKTIYIGGGTPSCLNLKELESLFDIINIFNLEKDYEFTIECNFDSIDYEKLKLFKERKVNRLSFGLETTNKDMLNLLERDLDKDKVITTINTAKKLGLENINVDLMYALIGEDIDMLKKDLDFILSLNVPHISLYSLILEEHTKLFLSKQKPIDEELDLKMYNTIHEILTNNGYDHYEISNYAKKDYYSRHNKVYWKNEYYYGFGLGASGYINNERYQNTNSPQKYLKEDFIYEKEKLTKKDKMVYELILGLRLKEGINEDEFYNKYHHHLNDVFNYNDLIKNGYLCYHKKRLYIPSNKWYVINTILLRFLEVKDGEK